MSNLHFHMREIGILPIKIYQWKYLNIVNFSILFVSDFEEVKSCIYLVENANAGMGLYWFQHQLFKLLLDEIVPFITTSVYKRQHWTTIYNRYPKLNLHIAGLRIWNGKKVIVKSWNIVRRRRTTVLILEYWDTVDCLLEKDLIQFGFTPTTLNLSTATEDIHFPNTMCSLTCSRGKVKFSPSLDGSPTSPR